MSKLYIVEINGHSVRTIRSAENLRVGSVIKDEIWLGNKILGGIVTKVIHKD